MLHLNTLLCIIIIIVVNSLITINTQQLSLCESLDDIEKSEVKKRHIRALCDAIDSAQDVSESNEIDDIPDFDLTEIQSDNDANQILKRFRRSRFFSSSRSGSSSSSRSSSSSSSGSSSRSSSSGSSSRSSSSGSRFFGSRSSSSSSSSGGSSRFFGSRSPSSSSSSSGGSSRFFSRGGSSSSSSSGSSHRFFSRTPSSSSSSSSGTGSSSNTGRQHRVREAVRSLFRRSSGSPTSGYSSGTATGGLAGGTKPSIKDRIRQITHGGSSGSKFSSGTSGSGFSSGSSSSGSGGNAWVRTGKKFLPVAVRFGKRYYQRRKYSKGMYAGVGAGAGYYAGSRYGSRYPPGGYYGQQYPNGYYGQQYPDNYYGYPPDVDTPPETIDGKPPSVFYCIQEDLNTTLINTTLNSEGMGKCNISGEIFDCPVEIECQMSEADNCCEDENGIPYCCGGLIPEEHFSQYGGYGDDMDDAAHSFNNMLNFVTAMSLVLATICFTMWRRQEH